ncbi:response regulator transcription factor [Streptomyces prunicolor]|uniref:Response regulator transcription factor n=1 Tax=Streptomyces prunicolor TaxID=67348 RepID=A0ABU4FBV9_9ACTN|nr:response regulator transcription factor [Streptomyces prunicolor]MDV7217493.1 response regulator transcription factor [Streptomyces prunicolor]
MTTVLIVNDQALQRLGLRMFLETQPDLTIVGEATAYAQAVRLADTLRPDVVLVDMGRPDEKHIQAIHRITRPDADPMAPDADGTDRIPPRVLILTPFDADESACAALRAGADGLLLKDALPHELTAALRTVALGGAVLSPRLTRALVDAVREQRRSDLTERRHRLSHLSGRECEVLAALASGWSGREIAERLSIAPTTVKSHISSILTKIGARARVQAVVFAYETGLVRPPRQRLHPNGTDFSDRSG